MWIDVNVTPIPLDIPVILSITRNGEGTREIPALKLVDDNHILLFDNDEPRFYCPHVQIEKITHWKKWRYKSRV